MDQRIEFQGRRLTVEATGSTREPFKLLGARGGVAYTLVRHPRLNVLYARDARGGYGHGWLTEIDGLPVWQRQRDTAAVGRAVARMYGRSA